MPVWAKQWMAQVQLHHIPWTRSSDGIDMKTLVARVVRCIFSVKNALILLWCFTLWWGERTVFRDTLATCAWNNWEKWVSSDIGGMRSRLLVYVPFVNRNV